MGKKQSFFIYLGNMEVCTIFFKYCRLKSLLLLLFFFCSACLENPEKQELAPYQEEFSADGGLYEPLSPNQASSYGSGASGAANSGGSNYASGASKSLGHEINCKEEPCDERESDSKQMEARENCEEDE